MKNHKIIYLLFFCYVNFANGQSPNSIDKFRFMEGIWKGNGWVLNENVKQIFKETETITTKLSGTIIQMEAFGTAVNDKANIINDALGILLFNTEKQQHELHIYQSDGSKAVADVKLNNVNEIELSLSVSTTIKIKYVIKITDKKWYETGFRSADGGVSWKQNFEMTLLKI